MSSPADDSSREWDEYRLLQEKLDRIGDFRFRVKTWCVGIFTGFLVAGSATNGGWITYVVSFPIILAFWLLETYHLHWQRALERRAHDLERHFNSIRSASVSATPSPTDVDWACPRIVHAITLADEELRKRGWRGRMLRRANGLFYLILVAIAIVLCVSALCLPRGPTRASAELKSAVNARSSLEPKSPLELRSPIEPKPPAELTSPIRVEGVEPPIGHKEPEKTKGAGG